MAECGLKGVGQENSPDVGMGGGVVLPDDGIDNPVCGFDGRGGPELLYNRLRITHPPALPGPSR